ncbi:MAG: CDP-alcohol phosphatidyltransferase family protein [Dehalococcoidia bacterium]
MPRARARQLLARYFEEPCARLLRSLKFTPNAVTVLGLVVTGGAAYLAARGAFWPAGLVLLFAGALDMLDGALARLTGKASRFGAALDSFTDRAAEALLLLGLLLYYLGQDHQAGVVLVFLVMVASYLVSYLRARGEGLGITMKETGLGTRTERVVVIIIGLLTHSAFLILVSLAVVLALSTFTSGQRLYHLWRDTRGE